MKNARLYFIVFVLLVVLMIALTESDFCVFFLWMLLPAGWMLFKAFEDNKSSD
jgi:hypothetical protein